jgi:hypothetical protein
LDRRLAAEAAEMPGCDPPPALASLGRPWEYLSRVPRPDDAVVGSSPSRLNSPSVRHRAPRPIATTIFLEIFRPENEKGLSPGPAADMEQRIAIEDMEYAWDMISFPSLIPCARPGTEAPGRPEPAHHASYSSYRSFQGVP